MISKELIKQNTTLDYEDKRVGKECFIEDQGTKEYYVRAILTATDTTYLMCSYRSNFGVVTQLYLVGQVMIKKGSRYYILDSNLDIIDDSFTNTILD